MHKLIKILLIAVSAALIFHGCAVTAISDVEQPAQAAADSNVTVYIAAMVIVMDSTQIFGNGLQVDSVLLAAALPAGWSCNGAEYYIDTDAYSTIMSGGPPTGAAAYEAFWGDIKLRGDENTAGREASFDAPLDAAYDTTGTKDQFMSFLGLQGFTVPAGTQADTFTIDTTGTTGVDTIWIKYVGCWCRLDLTVGSVPGDYALGYFVGIDPNNLGTGMGMPVTLNAFEDSCMMEIINNTAVRNGLSRAPALNLSVRPNPATSASVLSYFLPSAGHAVITLVDPSGRRMSVQRLPAAHAGWNSVSFGRLAGNPSMAAGTYLLRLEAGGKSLTKRITLVR
jgi:hypothetical protein